ncbi:MAG: glycosyltransferase family 39 protein [Actinomycetota bacterium]|nr:glycosyltransferase family 39 protein [Actinomycetota bacterium]
MTRKRLAILAGVVAAGAAARFATLDIQSLHHDEAVQARLMQLGFFDMLSEVVDGERSPPLYYLVHWPWTQLFGTGEVGLRSLSALIGTLMIPAALFAGRELRGERTGLIAAALVSVSPILVWYSQEARSYILMALFVTLALAFAARAQREPSPRSFGLWALFCSLALLSHYFAVFLIAPQVLWLFFAGDGASTDRRLWTAIGAIAFVAAALAPLALAQQGEDRRDGFADLSLPGRIAEVGLDYSASEDPDPLSGSPRVDRVQVVAGIGGAVLIVGACLLLWRRGSPGEQRRGAFMCFVAVAGIGVPALMAVLGLDFFKPRNMMAAVVPLLLLGALGFSASRAGRLGLAGAAAGCLLFSGVVVAFNLSEEMQREDWRRAAEVVGPADAPRLLAIPKNGDDPLLYYLGGERFLGRPSREGVAVRNVTVLSTTERIEPPAGFQVRERNPVPPLFTVWRLEAARPVNLTAAEVVGILDERAAALTSAAVRAGGL